jgi:outer membrane protease
MANTAKSGIVPYTATLVSNCKTDEDCLYIKKITYKENIKAKIMYSYREVQNKATIILNVRTRLYVKLSLYFISNKSARNMPHITME